MIKYNPPEFPAPNPDAHPADDLSFMRRKPDGGGMEYFAVTSTQNYFDDCALGNRLAMEFLAYIGKHPTAGNATLLGPIVADMIASGTSRGLIVGFMGVVNTYAMGAARILAEHGKDPE